MIEYRIQVPEGCVLKLAMDGPVRAWIDLINEDGTIKRHVCSFILGESVAVRRKILGVALLVGDDDGYPPQLFETMEVYLPDFRGEFLRMTSPFVGRAYTETTQDELTTLIQNSLESNPPRLRDLSFYAS